MNDRIIYYLDNIQKTLFYILLFVLPFSILPFPWDMTEFSMGLTIFVFASLILFCEIIRLFIRGVVYYNKDVLDTSVSIFILSMLVSTVFSKAPSVALWGFDYRLGTGFIAIIVAFILFYSARSFIKTLADIKTALTAVILGVTVSALLSSLSFWGVNVLKFMPSFDSLFSIGLPIYSSARITLVVSSIAFIFLTVLIYESIKEKKFIMLSLYVLCALLNLMNMIVFSLTQGYEIVLVAILILLSIVVILLLKRKEIDSKMNIVIASCLGVLSLLFILTRIPQIVDFIVVNDSRLITQMVLNIDTTWKVTSASFGDSLVNALIGIGNDGFSLAYNQFRPLSQQILILNSTNFTFATNHILNTLSNLGIVGMIVWSSVMYFTGRNLYLSVRKINTSEISGIYQLVLDFVIFFIALMSIFSYFTIIIYTIFFLLISLSTILKSSKQKRDNEALVISLSFFVHKPTQNAKKTLITTAVVVSTLLLIITNYFSLKYLVGSMYILKAEYKASAARELEDQKRLSDEAKADVLNENLNLYLRATALMTNDDMVHRRASLITNQYVELLAQKYNKTDDQNRKKELIDQLGTYVEISTELSRRATDLSPNVYSNWGARASIYSKLVGIGLTNYSKSALLAMQKATELNPLNYELYYNAAQLYVVGEDNTSAMRTLSQVFSINPQHVPSLLLAGEISLKEKNESQAEQYFKDAKDVMEALSNTDNELYRYTIEKLKGIESDTKPASTTPTDTNTDTTQTE